LTTGFHLIRVLSCAATVGACCTRHSARQGGLAMPEMTIGARIGMTVIVIALIGLLFVYHWLFTPRPKQGATHTEAEDIGAVRAGAARTKA
jgi:hypothetical protein